MNKTAIKSYAIWARVQLIEAAKQRAFEYAITDGENDPNLEIINGRILSSEEKNQRAELISLIKQKGFEQVMEEAAYTWFNRFIALRFMEVNGYLPTKVRVFTDENNEFKPQILKEAMTVDIDGIDKEKILGLIEKQDNEELFKYLIIAQCNALSFGLPGMFETISNWTELLFPANLLKADSVIGQMITTIPEEDWTDQVQIIGWLYQYYNSELKDDTFAKLKKNIKICKERIPAATQLFTPDWIVRYMVENSLGRLWYEGHPDFDKSEWKYYLDEAEQEPEVEEVLKKIRAEYAMIKPEEIKIIDPCMGSGHILVYAFDVLMQIYTSAGWSERDAAKSILENNLFGLDIDDRAGQLAYFAVMMKARKYNRRILNGEVRPKVLSIRESNGIDINLEKLGPEKVVAQKLIKELRDAKEYGSILNLSVKQEELEALKKRLVDIDEMSSYGSLIVQMESDQIINSLYPLIELAEIMIQKYDVVVTNPPYMGAKGMSNKLQTYVQEKYCDSKTDLFAVFIERGFFLTKQYGFNTQVTMQVWMFLTAFDKFRDKLMSRNHIVNLLHMDNMVMGIAFGTSATIFRKGYLPKYKARYSYTTINDLNENDEPKHFPIANNRLTYATVEGFEDIPRKTIAYWASPNSIDAYKRYNRLDSYASVKKGMSTADDNRFLRLWYEVETTKLQPFVPFETAKWYMLNKGGAFRRWYGNSEYVVNWKNNGEEMKAFKKAVIRNEQYYFRDYALTWTYVTNYKLNVRYTEKTAFAAVGPCIFSDKKRLLWVMGVLNTNVAQAFADNVGGETITYEVGEVASIPIAYDFDKEGIVLNRVQDNINISRKDWDSFETSWDFKKHPLV